MITEKKKRIPKPTRTEEVDSLVRLYIPFLEAEDQEAMLTAAVKIGQTLDVMDVSKRVEGVEWVELDSTESNLDLARKDWTESDYADLRDTASWLKRAIHHALHGQYLTGGEIGTWLVTASREISWTILAWGGPGRSVANLSYPKDWFKPEISMVRHWPKLIRSWGAWFTIAAFISKSGRAFIGHCPKCEKIFEKKTQRQIFCSPACQDALKQERYRKRKKDH